MTKTLRFSAFRGLSDEPVNPLESPSIKALEGWPRVRERRMHRLAALALPINRLDRVRMKSQSDWSDGIVASLSPKRLPNRRLSKKVPRSYYRHASRCGAKGFLTGSRR